MTTAVASVPNSGSCQQALADVGNGVAASLRGVDCIATDMTQAAFGRLFGTDGALLPALTILLTLYVTFLGFSLITGRARIGVNSLTPRMVTLGLVLTFVTSWVAYNGVVWNLAIGAPNLIAGILRGTQGSATEVFAQKIDVVFAAVSEAAGPQQADSDPATTFSPEGVMWLGAILLLLGTVGVMVTARIALAVLLALGPIFVVMALFSGTRGLFVGWLKGVVLLAIAPLFAVLGGTLMLELAVPVISSLAETPGEIDARAAMAFFLIGAVHVALMTMVIKTATTMVAGWSVFGLADKAPEKGNTTYTAPPVVGGAAAQPILPNHPQAAGAANAANAVASSAPRRVAVSGIAPGAAANDSGSAASGKTIRETTIVNSTGEQKVGGSAQNRARGIGSRFRSAPARSTEKLK